MSALHVADRPVRVMARRARHLAFANGHVRHRALGLHHLHAMAGGAHLRLGRLHQLVLHRLRRVHAVAGGAGEIPRGVGAGLPARMRAAVVAAETGLGDLGRFQFLEFLDVSLGVVIDVRLAGTMAAFAAERGGGRAGILGLPVPRVRNALRLRVVAEDAAYPCRRSREAVGQEPLGRAAFERAASALAGGVFSGGDFAGGVCAGGFCAGCCAPVCVAPTRRPAVTPNQTVRASPMRSLFRFTPAPCYRVW